MTTLDSNAARVPFVETSIATTINETINFVMSCKRTALVVGRPGIGKTVTLEHIHRRNEYAVYIEYRARHRTIKGMHLAIMEACGWAHWHKSGAEIEQACEACAESMKANGYFLLIDEYQNYDLEAIRAVLRFSDYLRLPIVFVGNEKRLRRVSADANTYEQIRDRISREVHLGDPVAEDFAAFALACYITDRVTVDAVVQLGMKTSLRHLSQVLEAALEIAPAGGVDLDTFRSAETFLRGGTVREAPKRLPRA